MMGAILSEEILKQYQDVCQKADLFLEQNKANEAIEEYQKALAVLPERIWSCSSYAYTGIGEAYQLLNDYHHALEAFINSYLDDQQFNPYILINIGICYEEIGDHKRGLYFLKKAYDIDQRVFEGLDKYKNML